LSRPDLTAPADPSLAPGEARCPGPSMQDILDADGDNPPAAMREQAYAFLGDEDLPFARYTDPAFHAAEMESLWPNVWQWACREEHIPDPGDRYVYDVGHHSVLVVRGADHQIRAFVNSCPHRGMKFASEGSRGVRRANIRCPFHGMSWNLDGTLREIPCRWDFPHITDANFGLDEVACDTWGGFVFIHMGDAPPPLSQQLEIMPEHFKLWPMHDRYVALHTEKVLPANWKMAMEAFLEAFHVLETHAQAVYTAADANAQYDIFGKHVSRFIHAVGVPSPHLRQEVSEATLFGKLGRDPAALPPGAKARAEHAKLLREELGAAFGTDLSQVSTTEMMDSIEYFLFPNAFFFPGINIRLCYRFRPLGPDECLHEILVLQPLPASGERPPPATPIRLGVEDSYTTVPGFALAEILDQDTENLKLQRDGAKASRKGAQTLGNYQEARIRRLHLTLDEYLSR
jgi:phenylpropionate dioxygenase-like ring-hydroxylating dioxygenase large terminal subunit